MVQGRDARLVVTDCKRSRRSGAGSDKPKREGNTPNSPRTAGNAQNQQTQALLTPINNGCQVWKHRFGLCPVISAGL